MYFLDFNTTIIYIPIIKFPRGKGTSDNSDDGSFVSQVSSSNCLSGVYFFNYFCHKNSLMKKLPFKLLTFLAEIYCDQMPERDEAQKGRYSKIVTI